MEPLQPLPAAPGTGDPYPSRVGGEAHFQPRRDPVLHAAGGSRAPGPLRPADLLRYEGDGFLFLERFLPDAVVADLARELEALVEARRQDRSPEVIREPERNEVRSIFSVHRTHSGLARLARHASLLAMVRQILGSRVYIHQSRVNLKPGFDGREFYWHSDFETWHVEDGMPRMRAVSASITLTENLALNGPLMVIPGSHHRYVACAGRTPPDHHRLSLRRQDHGVPTHDQLRSLVAGRGIEAPTGPPGSILLFDCNLMHGSNGNITPYPRSNVFFVYNSVENALVEPFSGQSRRPEHIASRDFTPLGST